MKSAKLRLLTLCLAIGIVLTLSSGTLFAITKNVYATVSEQITFRFNDEVKELPDGYTVLSYAGRTYVPARFIAQELGAEVEWDEEIQTIFITSDVPEEEIADEIGEEEEESIIIKYDYEKLPLQEIKNDVIVTVNSITIDRDQTRVYLKVRNLGELPVQLIQTETKFVIDGDTHNQSELTENERYRYDQTWFNDIREDESREGLIKMPDIPKDTEELILHLKAFKNDGSKEQWEYTYHINLR